MNQEQLQAIRKRVNKATEGPWYASHERRGEYVDSVGDVIAKCISDQCIDDTEFIAHAREDVPALLEEIERLRGVCEVLRDNMHQALGGYMSSCPECRGRLPAHFDDCELRQALAGESE